jgi:hypothetical protein
MLLALSAIAYFPSSCYPRAGFSSRGHRNVNKKAAGAEAIRRPGIPCKYGRTPLPTGRTVWFMASLFAALMNARLRFAFGPLRMRSSIFDLISGCSSTRSLIAYRLVGLTPEQKVAARKIFVDENAALQAFAPGEERMEKGTASRQNARAQIGSLLSPEQQKVYAAAPQRLGGSSTQDPLGRATRIDRVVKLTDEQTKTVVELLQKRSTPPPPYPPPIARVR